MERKTNFLQKLKEDLLTCPICLSTFQDPRQLPCQHIICWGCLHSHVTTRQCGDKFPCPFCRKDIKIPTNGLQTMTKCRIIGEIETILPTSSIKCNNCGSEDNLEIYLCMDCTTYTCGKCFIWHSENVHKRNLVMSDILRRLQPELEIIQTHVENVNTEFQNIHIEEQKTLAKALEKCTDIKALQEFAINQFSIEIANCEKNLSKNSNQEWHPMFLELKRKHDDTNSIILTMNESVIRVLNELHSFKTENCKHEKYLGKISTMSKENNKIGLEMKQEHSMVISCIANVEQRVVDIFSGVQSLENKILDICNRQTYTEENHEHLVMVSTLIKENTKITLDIKQEHAKAKANITSVYQSVIDIFSKLKALTIEMSEMRKQQKITGAKYEEHLEMISSLIKENSRTNLEMKQENAKSESRISCVNEPMIEICSELELLKREVSELCRQQKHIEVKQDKHVEMTNALIKENTHAISSICSELQSLKKEISEIRKQQCYRPDLMRKTSGDNSNSLPEIQRILHNLKCFSENNNKIYLEIKENNDKTLSSIESVNDSVCFELQSIETEICKQQKYTEAIMNKLEDRQKNDKGMSSIDSVNESVCSEIQSLKTEMCKQQEHTEKIMRENSKHHSEITRRENKKQTFVVCLIMIFIQTVGTAILLAAFKNT